MVDYDIYVCKEKMNYKENLSIYRSDKHMQVFAVTQFKSKLCTLLLEMHDLKNNSYILNISKKNQFRDNLKYNQSLVVNEEKKKSQCLSMHYIFPEKKIELGFFI